MPTAADPDDPRRLPSAEAILAGTLGLMTAHAQAGCDAQRRRISELVEHNLDDLAEHPALSSHFRLALSVLAAHWQLLEHRLASNGQSEQSVSEAESSWTH